MSGNIHQMPQVEIFVDEMILNGLYTDGNTHEGKGTQQETRKENRFGRQRLLSDSDLEKVGDCIKPIAKEKVYSKSSEFVPMTGRSHSSQHCEVSFGKQDKQQRKMNQLLVNDVLKYNCFKDGTIAFGSSRQSSNTVSQSSLLSPTLFLTEGVNSKSTESLSSDSTSSLSPCIRSPVSKFPKRSLNRAKGVNSLATAENTETIWPSDDFDFNDATSQPFRQRAATISKFSNVRQEIGVLDINLKAESKPLLQRADKIEKNNVKRKNRKIVSRNMSDSDHILSNDGDRKNGDPPSSFRPRLNTEGSRRLMRVNPETKSASFNDLQEDSSDLFDVPVPARPRVQSDGKSVKAMKAKSILSTTHDKHEEPLDPFDTAVPFRQRLHTDGKLTKRKAFSRKKAKSKDDLLDDVCSSVLKKPEDKKGCDGINVRLPQIDQPNALKVKKQFGKENKSPRRRRKNRNIAFEQHPFDHLIGNLDDFGDQRSLSSTPTDIPTRTPEPALFREFAGLDSGSVETEATCENTRSYKPRYCWCTRCQIMYKMYKEGDEQLEAWGNYPCFRF